MTGWLSILFFIFSTFTIIYYVYKLAVAFFSVNVAPFSLNIYEKLLLGMALSYWLTFLIA